jgi:hypothetical protein
MQVNRWCLLTLGAILYLNLLGQQMGALSNLPEIQLQISEIFHLIIANFLLIRTIRNLHQLQLTIANEGDLYFIN